LKNKNIKFEKINKISHIPYDLLLLADPSKSIIDEYLNQSEIFFAILKEDIVGVIVLFPLTEDVMEIKNIAVKEELNGQGIGSFLIKNVVEYASKMGKQSICIGTANSSFRQLYLYQKLGFDISEIIKYFFLDKYDEPIFENGIQAMHKIMLLKHLSNISKPST